MAKATRNRLGRGLDALLAPPDEIVTSGSSSINEIELDRIEPNPGQPRSIFEEESLEELAQSLRTYGVIQPIILKEKGDGHYLIIAGERRYRAAERIGLDKIPAYIKTAEDENIAELALIENIQREDLNPIEEAHAYQRLLTEFRLSQEELARRVARSRSAIANSVRLLRLAEEVQAFIANGVLTMGQVRPLLALESKTLQSEAAEYIQEHELTARGVEALVKRLIKDPNALKKTSAAPVQRSAPDIFVREAEERLTRSLGTKVSIRAGREEGKGKLEISYFSADDLERLLGLLTAADGAAKEDKRAALRAVSAQNFTV